MKRHDGWKAQREPRGGRMRPPLHRQDYRRAATIGALGVSVPVGIVVTRAEPFAPAGAAAGAAINPSAFRTSVSSFAITSLLSFRNCRAFSRPWPIRSLL